MWKKNVLMSAAFDTVSPVLCQRTKCTSVQECACKKGKISTYLCLNKKNLKCTFEFKITNHISFLLFKVSK